MTTTRLTGRRRSGLAVAGAALALLALAQPGAGQAATTGPAARSVKAPPPSHTVPADEQRPLGQRALTRMVGSSEPLALPTRAGTDGARPQDGPGGRELRVPGVAPTGTSGGSAGGATAGRNGAWPGAAGANPNRQIGKLYFDVQPGTGIVWKHCTATAINSENKSLVLTAGHCVYAPDPDGNGVVSGNGRWYEHVQFCPGYENSCRLGVWHARQMSTTSSWFYGVGGRYDFRDDVAVVLVNPNASGHLVNVVGGQGVVFNSGTGLQRHAFGYPAADSRWPQYSYNGQDLIYCQGRDTVDPGIAGTMYLPCTMTGGASGGPWLTSPNASWLGYVNSVNSHKPHGGAWMSGPYFGNAERDLFQYWRAR